MIRVGIITAKGWKKIIEEADKYGVDSDHPAKLQHNKTRIVYWHCDGFAEGYWHAEVRREPDGNVYIKRGKDARARSEIHSWEFLDALLDLTKHRVEAQEAELAATTGETV